MVVAIMIRLSKIYKNPELRHPPSPKLAQN
jgi:hypothetical protein